MTKKQISGIIGLTLAMFMGVLDSTIVNMALPKIQNHFHTTLTGVSWISTIYVLALSIFMITSAKLADQYGRKKIMLIGLLIFTFFSGACVWAPTLLWLIIFRFFQGLGGAMITPIVMPIGIELVGKEKMPLVASIVGAVTGLAAAGGPPLGGLIIQYLHWDWIFAINLPIGLVTIFLITFCINESYDNTVSKKIDFFGILLLSGGLFGLVFGLLKGQSYGWQSTNIIISLCVGITFLILFIIVELQVKDPLIELKLFKEKTFSASAFICFISGIVLVCPVLIFNYYLQEVLNYKPLHATLIIAILSLMVFFMMPLGTYVAQKINYIFVNLVGLMLIAVSLLGMTLITDKTPDSILVVFMILNGTGFGFMSQTIVSSIRFLPTKKSGIGSGIINSSRQLGTCLGIALMVALLNVGINSAKLQTKNYGKSIIKEAQVSKEVKRKFKSLLQTAYSTDGDQEKLSKQKNALLVAMQRTDNLVVPARKSFYYRSYLSLDEIEHQLVQTQTDELLQFIEKNKIEIQLTAQASVVNTLKNKIQNRQIIQVTKSFKFIYLVGALISFLTLPVVFFTDRKTNKK
ncbi:MFS transporter [Liquorilactobacillus uvarum]|uniref:MFS transporter n=2 Tax=Bacillati TaxID=1783272 RepID=UPI002889FA35|nr:MFS transporter [Liquorilactobacillus uvarum]